MDYEITLPRIKPFPYQKDKSDKQIALKVLEEAAELVEAVKDGDKDHVLEEYMDTLQALGNLAFEFDFSERDFRIAYDAVYNKNLDRGRYDEKD